MPTLFREKEELSHARSSRWKRCRFQNGALRGLWESLASKSMAKNAGDIGGLAKELLAWLRPRENEMAALLAELVAVPTENPPGKNYGVCADLLEHRLKRMGLGYERLEVEAPNSSGGGNPACLVASHGSGECILYFHGHYD